MVFEKWWNIWGETKQNYKSAFDPIMALFSIVNWNITRQKKNNASRSLQIRESVTVCKFD